MKKYLIALAICCLFVLALATTVMADNGPHGSFAADTDACASCHRVHTAKYGSNSLLITDPESLCMYCHNGAGAGTNVEDGVYALANAGGKTEGTDGAPLMGGGFDHALMATKWSGAATANPAFNAVSRPTTSMHDMGTSGTVWGSGANNSTPGTYVMECTSCHDPHGTAGWNTTPDPDVRVPSYRLLRWQPQGSNGFTVQAANVNWSGGAFPNAAFMGGGPTPTMQSVPGWLVPDNFATLGQEWYTIGTTGAFAFGDYSAGNGNNVYNVKNPAAASGSYIPAAVNTAFFCAQCHDRYFNNSRLRNHTEVSMFCGSPLNGTTPPFSGSPLFLPFQPDADGIAPWIHPVDPVRCLPVTDSAGAITGWGDNGASGDATYMYRHASGDIRLSSDGATNAGAGTSVSRSCMACHVAHGTAATMTALAEDDLTNDSALLRMDNRSTCLRCHAGGVNYTVGP